jgi:hypothetical protein
LSDNAKRAQWENGAVLALRSVVSPPSCASRIVNAFAFWLVLALAMMASCASTMPGGCTKDKAYVTAAKSDLRNMLGQQLEFREHYGRFAAGHEVHSEEFGFRGATGVRVYIEHADAASFRARSAHTQLPNVTCIIESSDGEPRCHDIDPAWQPPRQMQNRALNIAVDLWLFVITLARRQRRLSLATASQEFAPAA